MKKTSLVIFLLLIISLFFCSTCYAVNEFGTEMQDSANKTQESMQNAGNGIMDFTNNVSSGVKNMAEGIGNGIRDTAENIGQGVQDMFNGDNPNTTTNSEYNAVRTSTNPGETNGTSMASTAWVWLILGITGIIIVALTWYYVSQDNTHTNK